MTDTPFDLFHNRLRIMLNIDLPDAEMALSRLMSLAEWTMFVYNPWRWFIQADTADAQAVFRLIETREAARAARLAEPVR